MKNEAIILENYLIEFKDITLNMINILNTENIDSVEALMMKREDVIKDIKDLNYSKEIFEDIAKKLELEALEIKLRKSMEKKKEQLREKIEELKTTTVANKSYIQNTMRGVNFLNKKI